MCIHSCTIITSTYLIQFLEKNIPKISFIFIINLYINTKITNIVISFMIIITR